MWEKKVADWTELILELDINNRKINSVFFHWFQQPLTQTEKHYSVKIKVRDEETNYICW